MRMKIRDKEHLRFLLDRSYYSIYWFNYPISPSGVILKKLKEYIYEGKDSLLIGDLVDSQYSLELSYHDLIKLETEYDSR